MECKGIVMPQTPAPVLWRVAAYSRKCNESLRSTQRHNVARASRAMSKMVETCLASLQAAQKISDDFEFGSELHRLAMTFVFVLEDCHETVRRLHERDLEEPQAVKSGPPDPLA